MGNQIEEKSKLLVKNWVKVDEKTYRNAITQELINLYTINYHSQEEMQIGQGNLMKRANINHPNVIKLIYFCSNQQKGMCTDKKYSHQVYLQQHGQRLSGLLSRPNDLKINQCFCCTIVSAFCFLTSKYGFFKADFSMIFLSQQSKWQKTNSKKIVKLWINQKVQSNRPEVTCKQQEACRSIVQILLELKKIRNCDHLDKLSHLQNFGKIDRCVEEVYRAHNQQRQALQRKKIASTYSNTLKNTVKQNHSSFQTLNLRNQRSFSGYIRQQAQAIPQNKPSKQTYRLETMPSTQLIMKKNNIRPEQPKHIEPFDRNSESNLIRNSRRVNFCYIGNPIQQDTPRQVVPEFKIKVSSELINQFQQQQPKIVSKKIPKLQSQTINLKLQSCQMLGERQRFPSFEDTDSILRKKLEQINESEPKIASSPFLIEVNQQSYSYKDELKAEKPFTNLSEFQQCQQQKLNVSDDERDDPEIHINEDHQKPFIIEPNMIPISKSLRQSDSSYIVDKKEAVPLDNFTRMELQKSPQFGGINQPPLLPHTSLKKFPERYPSNYSRQSSDSGYESYLQRFNQAINPMSPRSKFSNKSPFETIPAYKSKSNNIYTKIPIKQSQSMYLDNSVPKWQPNPSKFMEMSDKIGQKKPYKEKTQIESLYNESEDHSQDNKARIIQRIQNTEKKMRQNRKKLEKIQLQKDLQREKVLIKKQMQSLLKNNLISDESNRIKEKVKYKKASFAELKAEAAKILEDLNF